MSLRMHCNRLTVNVRVRAWAIILVLEIAGTCTAATGVCSSNACGVLCAGLVASIKTGLSHACVIAAWHIHSTCQDEGARVCARDSASVIVGACVASRAGRSSRGRY
jgi:hypothetical protein